MKLVPRRKPGKRLHRPRSPAGLGDAFTTSWAAQLVRASVVPGRNDKEPPITSLPSTKLKEKL